MSPCDPDLSSVRSMPLSKSSKHCEVGHRSAVGQSIFARNLCGLPEQGGNCKLLLCGGQNTQVEQSLDECKKCEIGSGNSKLLAEKVDEAIAENKRITDKTLLDKRFNLAFKPILASRLLLLPKGISDPSTLFLYDQYHLANRKEPNFLSAYELTRLKKRINDAEEWDTFMSMILSRRVFVVDAGKSNVGNIEICNYYQSINGANDGAEFYRGEVDASFHDSKENGVGKATLSIVLWKGNKCIHAEVFKDVSCVSIHAAEAYAVLALCFFCLENGIKDLELWTDNSDIHDAISGSLTVKGDRKDKNVLLLLGHIRTWFNRLICMKKRREHLFLADDLSHRTGKTELLEDYLNKWEYELRGKAFFRLSQAPSLNETMKYLKKKNTEKYTVRPQTKYFMEITQLSKLDVISMIAETLRPSVLYLAIHDLEKKPQDFISQVEVITGNSMMNETVEGDCSLLQFGDPVGRKLLIVFDATVPEDWYTRLGLFTIIFARPGERALLDPRIEEASALTYVYFNGVLTGNRKQG